MISDDNNCSFYLVKNLSNNSVLPRKLVNKRLSANQIGMWYYLCLCYTSLVLCWWRCTRTRAVVRRCVVAWAVIEQRYVEHYRAHLTSPANYVTSSTVRHYRSRDRTHLPQYRRGWRNFIIVMEIVHEVHNNNTHKKLNHVSVLSILWRSYLRNN